MPINSIHMIDAGFRLLVKTIRSSSSFDLALILSKPVLNAEELTCFEEVLCKFEAGTLAIEDLARLPDFCEISQILMVASEFVDRQLLARRVAVVMTCAIMQFALHGRIPYHKFELCENIYSASVELGSGICVSSATFLREVVEYCDSLGPNVFSPCVCLAYINLMLVGAVQDVVHIVDSAKERPWSAKTLLGICEMLPIHEGEERSMKVLGKLLENSIGQLSGAALGAV